jgi:hypothetical protein
LIYVFFPLLLSFPMIVFTCSFSQLVFLLYL